MYCPNGHGLKSTPFCDECGAPTAAVGDSVHIRRNSPEAHATVNPTFILPGGHGAAPGSSLVKCPRCGRRNAESSTFDCQGGCERQHLCERHFDEEYEVCQDCAARLRKTAEAAAAERQALEADRSAWRSKAERLDKELAAAQATQRKAEATHAAVKAELEGKVAQLTAAGQAAEARVATLEQDVQTHRTRAAELTRQLADARRSLAEAEAAHAAAQTALATADKSHAAAQQTLQGRLDALSKAESGWRSRAESAETQVAEIRRMEEAAAEKARQEAAARAAEEQRKAEAAAAEKARQEAAARAAEEQRKAAAKSQPRWQQIGIELVQIPAGEFLYGDDKKRVKLDAFAIAKTPVTNQQYKAFVDATGHSAPTHWNNGIIPAGKEQHPVVYVSWDDAQAFCQWAGVALPTEQQWEKAARGTDGRTYPWGNEAPDKTRCNFNKDVGDTTPVGKYPAGANGLFDMAGNVWEWCADWYLKDSYRVLRGGSWWTTGKESVRCAFRDGYGPGFRFDNVGFRVVSPGS